MQSEMGIGSLKEIDPHALNLVSGKRNFYYTFKRIVDLILAIIVLIIFSPLMALIAILIKLDSPGPVFFRQDRVGVKRRKIDQKIYWQKENFKCYKFRTMICNADPELHKSFIKALIYNDTEKMASLQGEKTEIRKLTRDPRITRLGRFLRKSSLDELPQFINVIKGEMSIVGPRPAIPYELELYKPWHFQRLETKPGITGLWQVTARSVADFDKSVALDIQYIEQQSLWMDLKIIVMTPLAVFSCKGAV